MAILYEWEPDTCASFPPCKFDAQTGKVLRLCASHAPHRAGGKRDDEIFEIVKTENREARSGQTASEVEKA